MEEEKRDILGLSERDRNIGKLLVALAVVVIGSQAPNNMDSIDGVASSDDSVNISSKQSPLPPYSFSDSANPAILNYKLIQDRNGDSIADLLIYYKGIDIPKQISAYDVVDGKLYFGSGQ